MAKQSRLSPELTKALQYAYGHELKNENIYAQVSSWLDNAGLYNLSEYYKDWSNEEKKHSEWVKDFLMSMDKNVNFAYTLELEEIDFSNMYAFTEKTIEREYQTTDIYNDVFKIAFADNHGPAMDFVLNTMQKEQTEEEDKAVTLYDQVHNLQGMDELQRFDLAFKKDYY